MRQSAAPWSLGFHITAIALALAGTLVHSQLPLVWAGVVLMALTLWHLARGARLAWWIQVLGLPLALFQLLQTPSVFHTQEEFAVFVHPDRVSWVAPLLVVAWAVLLLPSVRDYVFLRPVGPRRAGSLGFVVAILIFARIPSSAFGVVADLPSRTTLDEVRDATFIAGEQGVAFYARQSFDELCLMEVEHSGYSSSCTNRMSLKYSPGISRSNKLLSDIVRKAVVRVEVVSPQLGRQEASMVIDDRFFANFYYLVNGPDFYTPVEIIGYDDSGHVLFHERSGSLYRRG